MRTEIIPYKYTELSGVWKPVIQIVTNFGLISFDNVDKAEKEERLQTAIDSIRELIQFYFLSKATALEDAIEKYVSVSIGGTLLEDIDQMIDRLFAFGCRDYQDPGMQK